MLSSRFATILFMLSKGFSLFVALAVPLLPPPSSMVTVLPGLTDLEPGPLWTAWSTLWQMSSSACYDSITNVNHEREREREGGGGGGGGERGRELNFKTYQCSSHKALQSGNSDI